MALTNLTKVGTLGIGSNIEVVGVVTTGQFKSGTSNLHSTGVELTNLNVSGIATIGGNLSIGGTLTYQDVTNIDSVGLITARAGVNVSAGQLDVGSNIKIGNAGVITATSFSGSGASLTGIDTDLLSDSSPQLGGDLDTNGNNIVMDDNDEIRLGDSGDFQLFHNSSTGEARIFNSNAAGINIITDLFNVKNNANNETLLNATNGGAVELYFNNSKKFETYSNGVKAANNGHIKLASDSGKFFMGTGDDAELFHDGTNLTLNGDGTNATFLRAKSGENSIKLIPDGAVELYHDNSKKFETANSGCTVTGQLLVPQDFVKLNDNVELKLGNGDDLQLYHDASNSYVIHNNGSGHLYIQGDAIKLRTRSATGTETYISCNHNGPVELYYDNSKKFETISTGIQTVEVVKMTHGSNGVNFKQVFEQGVGNTASCSATVPACVGGGTVTITVMHNGNNSITTTKMFPIMIRNTTTTVLGSEIFSINHLSTASFSVSAINQGIAVTNNAGAHAKVRITFDITANV